MLDQESWTRIARYALGECTAAEAVESRAWIEASAERKQVAEELIRLADAGPRSLWDAGAAWERFTTPTPAKATPVRYSRPLLAGAGESLNGGRHRWWMAAAAAVVLATGGALVWQIGRKPESVAIAPAPLRSVVTKPGQTADVYLGDGTHVALGAASTLRFPATFASARDVYLEGEAYFDVVHDETRPFAVHTARAVARDIGTKFVVRSFAGGTTAEVVVAEGAVALTPAARPSAPSAMRDSLLLTRADLGRLGPNGSLSISHHVDVDSYLAWTRGRLEFAGAPLGDALPELGRWYDVDVRLGDSSLAHARLTASLEIESLSDALTLIAGALDARVERQGRTVTLYPKRPTRSR
jgi:transmembrane sensor